MNDVAVFGTPYLRIVLACSKFAKRSLELSVTNEATEAVTAAGDQILQCLSIWSIWARCASPHSTAQNVREHSAADHFEVLHVGVVLYRWLTLTERVSQSICHDRPIWGPAR